MSGGWALAGEPIRSAASNTRRTQQLGLRLGLPGACNAPLSWLQRFMVANVALPLQCLQNRRCTCGVLHAGRGQRADGCGRPPLRGPFLAGEDMTALCMQRANHENAAGPQQPKDDRLKWWETRCRRQKPMFKTRAQKCQHTATFPVRWRPPFGRPSLEPRGRSSSCQRSCSELRRQTSPLSFDSARLRDNRLVCTGALCDCEQPPPTTFCDTPLPIGRPSLATGMYCSVVRQCTLAWNAGPSRCRTLGLQWHHIRPLSLEQQMCHTHHRPACHPAAPP